MAKDKLKCWSMGTCFLCVLFYCALFIAQLFFRRIVNVQELGRLNPWKSTIPFPIGWCSTMEWFMPLILCVGYVAVYKGYEDLWRIVKGLAVVALVELYCGRYGISCYFSADEGISFCDKKYYIHDMNPKYIPSLVWYFIGCVVCTILLLQIMPKMVGYMQSKGKMHLCTGVVYLFCLSDGILFNVYYFGEYTIWYITRNLVLLFFLVLTLRQLPKYVSDFSYSFRVKIDKTGGILSMCVLICILVWSIGPMINKEYIQYYEGVMSIRGLYKLILHISLDRNYMVILITVISMYLLKDKMFKKWIGIVAVVNSAAFLIAKHICVIYEMSPKILAASKFESKRKIFQRSDAIRI